LTLSDLLHMVTYLYTNHPVFAVRALLFVPFVTDASILCKYSMKQISQCVLPGNKKVCVYLL
jgi:hypothetical protein